jgi:hypothetical protein
MTFVKSVIEGLWNSKSAVFELIARPGPHIRIISDTRPFPALGVTYSDE